MSASDTSIEKEVEILMEVVELDSTDPPMSEWSSLIIEKPERNLKRYLHSQGLYNPEKKELCTKYIPMSDSAVIRHPYYDYPSVKDPGIKDVLQCPQKRIRYSDDGQDLYMVLCEEMNICPIREFHRNLLKEKIVLSYYGVNPKGVRAMALALKLNFTVQTLDLTDNFLDDDGVYHLGEMLVDNTALKELCLSGCRIGPKGIQNLSAFLPKNKTLKNLNLSRNCLGDSGAEHLAKAMIKRIYVSHLNLSNNNLGSKTALAFFEALSYDNKLTHLDLSWNQLFNVPTTVKLLYQIAESKILKKFNLSWNALGGERIAQALKIVMLIPSLTLLDLSNNKFCNEAIPPIIQNLISAKKLRTLNLSYNPLTPSDAYKVLQKMLRPQVKLERLLLDDVYITKEFLWLLEQVLRMKCRKNAVITYGSLIRAYCIEEPDKRELIMKRADYLGNCNKRNRVDIGLYFLTLHKVFTTPIETKELLAQLQTDQVPLGDDLVNELVNVFPGPRTAKTTTLNIQALVDYIHRIWPDRMLPSTPDPEPELPPIKVPTKKKGKK